MNWIFFQCMYIWSSGSILWCDQMIVVLPALAALSVRFHCLIKQHGSFSWRTQLRPQRAVSVQLQHLLQILGRTKCSLNISQILLPYVFLFFLNVPGLWLLMDLLPVIYCVCLLMQPPKQESSSWSRHHTALPIDYSPVCWERQYLWTRWPLLLLSNTAFWLHQMSVSNWEHTEITGCTLHLYEAIQGKLPSWLCKHLSLIISNLTYLLPVPNGPIFMPLCQWYPWPKACFHGVSGCDLFK